MSDQKQTAPPTFADSQSRSWTIRLSLDLLDEVQNESAIDLVGDNGDTTAVIGLLFNRQKLGEVLWACCRASAEKQGIDRKAFRSALDGEALTNGWGALVDAIVFFTPKQSQAAVKAAFDKQMEALEQGLAVVAKVTKSEEANSAIQQMLATMETEIKADLPQRFANAATN